MFYENHRVPSTGDLRRRPSPIGPPSGSNIISLGPFLHRNVTIANIQGFLRSKNCRGFEKIDIDGDYAFITFLDADCAFQAVKKCNGEKFFQTPVQVRQLSLLNREPESRFLPGDFAQDPHMRNSLALQHHQNAGGFTMSGPSFGSLSNFDMPNLSLQPPLMQPSRRPNLMDELPQPLFVPISSPEHSRNERDDRRRSNANEKNARSATREDRDSNRKSNKADSKDDRKSSARKSNGKASNTDRKSTDNSKKDVIDKKNDDKGNIRSSESSKRKSYASEENKNEKRPRSRTSDEQRKKNGDGSLPAKYTTSGTPKGSQELKTRDLAEVSSINSAYGQVIAGRLEKLDEKQQAYVKLKIEEVFFSVEFGSIPAPQAPSVLPAFPSMLNPSPSVDYANLAAAQTYNSTSTAARSQTSRERRSRH